MKKIDEEKIIRFFCFVYAKLFDDETGDGFLLADKDRYLWCAKIFWRFYFCTKYEKD